MSDIWKAVILGLVEGATEFIPVSSTGHLILAGHLLGFTGERAAVFEVFIQLGAILAIVWLYREKLFGELRRAAHDETARRFFLNVAIAFVPAAAVGFFVHDWIEEHLFNPITVAAALVAGGLAILVIERWASRRAPVVEDVDGMPPRTALGVGIAQVLSLFPGVSRSGATIMGAYVLGLSRKAATEFSFFLAIPVMVAATGYSLLKGMEFLSAADVPVFAVGFVVSFFSALVVVRAFVAFVSKSSFVPFAWYRIVLGGIVLLYHFAFGLTEV